MKARKDPNWLDEPTCCDNCGHSDIRLYDMNKMGGKAKSDWPYVWHCKKCKAQVGCHKGTNYPLGYMATSVVRLKRSVAHRKFDELFEKHALYDRNEAYSRLAFYMGIERTKCHIGMFDEEQCKQVTKFCKKELSQFKGRRTNRTYVRGKLVSSKGRHITKDRTDKKNANTNSHQNFKGNKGRARQRWMREVS